MVMVGVRWSMVTSKNKQVRLVQVPQVPHSYLTKNVVIVCFCSFGGMASPSRSLPSSFKVALNYCARASAGKRTGRYIGVPDAGHLEDRHSPTVVTMRDGRQLGASLAREGFELREGAATSCASFFYEQAHSTKRRAPPLRLIDNFYDETTALVTAATGAQRVVAFDYTLRVSGRSELNSLDGLSAAAPVSRVHGDYTHASAAKRLLALIDEGTVQLADGETSETLLGKRWAFCNVWRNVAPEPVQRAPLAVCAADSVHESETWAYEMVYPGNIYI